MKEVKPRFLPSCFVKRAPSTALYCQGEISVFSLDSLFRIRGPPSGFGNRGTRAFILGKQEDKGLKMRGTSEQRQF